MRNRRLRSFRKPNERLGLHGEALERRSLLTLTPLGEPIPLGDVAPTDAEFSTTGELLVSYSGTGAEGIGVYTRKYSADGAPLGPDSFVNAGSSPRVAWGPNGESFVTWQGTGSSGNGVYGRAFDAAGAALSDVFFIGAGGNQQAAIESSGELVSVWSSAAGFTWSKFAVDGTPAGTVSIAPGSQAQIAFGNRGHAVITRRYEEWDDVGIRLYYSATAQFVDASGIATPEILLESGVLRDLEGVDYSPEPMHVDEFGNVVIRETRFVRYRHWSIPQSVNARRFDVQGNVIGEHGPIMEHLGTLSSAYQTVSGEVLYQWGLESSRWDAFTREGYRLFDGYIAPAVQFLANSPVGGRVAGLTRCTEGNDRCLAFFSDATRPLRMLAPGVQYSMSESQPLVAQSVSQLAVAFSESLATSGEHSVLDPANWRLLRDGVDVSETIANLTFGYDDRQMALAAVLHLSEPLTVGRFEVVATSDIRDLRDRPLDGDSDGMPGGDFVGQFDVMPRFVGMPLPVVLSTDASLNGSSIAVDDEGNAAAVWTTPGGELRLGRINPSGNLIEAPTVIVPTGRSRIMPDIAMDADGDFLVAWSVDYLFFPNAQGEVASLRFNKSGQPTGAGPAPIGTVGGAPTVSVAVDDNGGALLYVGDRGTADAPRNVVAMDADGDFAVLHSEYDSTSYLGTNYLRAPAGATVPVGGTFYNVEQGLQIDLSMDDVGNSVAVWFDSRLRAQRFDFNGNRIGVEIVFDGASARDNIPRVAMTTDGAFAVAWTSGTDVYAQRFDRFGEPASPPFRVNAETEGEQSLGDLAMSPDGSLYVTWHGDSPQGLQTFFQFVPAAPTVNFVGATLSDDEILPGERITQRVERVFVEFSAEVATLGGASGTDSALNPANWRLLRNGNDESGRISVIEQLSDDETPTKVKVSFNEALPEGNYELIATSQIVGVNGYPLDGDSDGRPGGDFTRSFIIAYPRSSGPEFPVNETTAGDQRTSPASLMNIAMRPDGTFVTTWASLNQDGSGWGVYARLFNASGQPVTGEFRVNQFTGGDQRFSTVAMEANGAFVVTWTSDGQDGDGYGVYARRYSANGTPFGNEFRINQTIAGLQGKSSIAMDDDGDFIVVWESKNQDGFGYGVYARRYSADGQAASGEFLVNQTVLSDQRLAGVAMAPDGKAVVTWTSFNQDGSGDGIYARRIGDGTAPGGDEFRVNTTTASTQRFSRVAMDRTGDFVVAWMSNLQDGDGYGIYAQRFDQDGTPEGGEFRVNQTTAGHQQYPVLDLDDDGDFVIAWASANQDGDDFGIYARRYSPGGVAQGDEFRVNTTTAGQQNLPSVAMDADGDFTVVWNSVGQDGDGFGVFAQRYSANSGPTADAGGPYEVLEGAALALNAGGSTDPDQGDVLTFSWDLNGDDVFGDATGATPTVAWAQLAALGINDGAATWNNVRVRATDSAGNFDEAVTSLAVANVAPTIALAGAAAVNEGATYSLTLGAITDPGADTVTSWTVRWGDGTSDTYASGGVKTHMYANGPATNTIRVDLTDEDGVFPNAGTRQVTVNNVPPALSGVTAATINEHGVAHIRGTIVDSGPLDAFSLQVYWGDSATPETVNLPAGTTTFDIPHQYLDDPTGPPPDEFPIDIILRDSDGAQDTDSLRITVRNVAPDAAIEGLQNENPVGSPVSLTAEVFDPGTLDLFTYGWRVERDGVLFASGSGVDFSFTPDADGVYAVQLTVQDDDGGVDVVTANVRVPGGETLPGDTNADGVVDLVDLNNVRNNFGGAGLGDTNGDGVVDLVDLNAVRNNFGASLSPGRFITASRAATDAVFQQWLVGERPRFAVGKRLRPA